MSESVVEVINGEVKARTVLMTDPDWPDYVLSQLTEDEVFNGHPRADGLWRLVEKLLGPIVSYTVKSVKVPTASWDTCSVVEARIEIDPYADSPLTTPGRERCGGRTLQTYAYDGVGDSTELNTNPGFERFSPRIAETRARGRACRTALRLYRVVTADEMDGAAIADPSETITPTQLACLDAIGAKCNVDVVKWVKAEAARHRVNLAALKRLRDLPKVFGLTLCKEMTKVQASGKVPEDMKGYDPNWRN